MKFSIYTFIFYITYFKFSGTYKITKRTETECRSVVSDCPGQNTGVCSRFLLQGIFPTQGSNPGLPHGRQILYQLSH